MIVISPETVFALLAGILIFLAPRQLRYVLALYFILSGVHGLLHAPDVQHPGEVPATERRAP